jgi:hypothetical protein
MRTALDLLLALALLALFGSFQGCASVQKERALLFAPEGLPSNKQLFTRNYAEALKAVDTGQATPAEMVTYVDAGNALLAKQCADWMDRLTLARRGYVADDHTLAIFSGLLMTLAGAFAWPADVITVLGAGTVAAQGFGQSRQQDVLGAPSQWAAQNAIFAAQEKCGNDLLIAAPKLEFSQAYLGLEKCARVCSHDAASDAVTRALMGAKP